MLTKLIALPCAVLIFPAYYRWSHRQQHARQRYASHQRYLRLERQLRLSIGMWQVSIEERLANRLARDIARNAQVSLGTYRQDWPPLGLAGW